MATHLPDQIFRPVSHLCVSSRRQLTTGRHNRISLPPFKPPRNGNLSVNGTTSTHQDSKWAVRLSLVEQQSNPTNSTFDINRVIDFLYEDLPHLFDDQGIDRTMYDEKVKFRDPITKHDTVSGYLFNITLLKKLFEPEFQLHKAEQFYVRTACHFRKKVQQSMAISIRSSSVFHLGFPSQCSSKYLKFKSENHPISVRCSSSLRRNFQMNTKQRQIQASLSSSSSSSSSSSPIDFEKFSSSIFQMNRLYHDKRLAEELYDESISFQDPITCVHSLDDLLIYFDVMKFLFHISAKIHHFKQTGPYEITTRWTMVMKFVLLPWRPELVFTGTSVMGINPKTQKFCSHVDFWDSIENNDYFSLEGLVEVIKQLRIYKTPDLETPKYQILKKTANYEVRKYDPFVIVETKVDKLSGSNGFNDVAGYIFGKNSSTEKIPMTTPVFTQAFDEELSKTSIQIVLPSEKDFNSLPKPNKEELGLRKVEGGIAVVSKFSGKPTEDIVRENEKRLRMAALKDGLKPKHGCLFARYNDPGRTWDFIMRNEVLIWLEEFTLD